MTHPSITALVRADLEQRIAAGQATYGQPLLANDGRDTKRDLLDELWDAVFYETKDVVEREQLRELVEQAFAAIERHRNSPAAAPDWAALCETHRLLALMLASPVLRRRAP